MHSGAAAPSLPGLLPNFISGLQPTTLPLVCQQGGTHSRGPLPHHYQGRCPIITRAAAPSLPGPLPHHYQGRCPIITRAAAPSLPGPLPHHYQGRSPPCSRWSAKRAAHSLWGRCPIITRAPARLYLRAAAHHGPIGLPTGMHALSWPTAPSLLGLQPDFSQPQPTLLLWVCHQGSAPPGLSVSGPQPTRPYLAHPQVRVRRGAAGLSWL